MAQGQKFTGTVNSTPITEPPEIVELAAAVEDALQQVALREQYQPNHVLPRSGLRKYLRFNIRVSITFICGVGAVMISWGLTYWLASLTLECASFSYCKLDSFSGQVRNKLNIIQGALTMFYLAGLAGIMYTACALFESGLYCVLTRQSFTIDQLERYISVGQGSRLSLLRLVFDAESLPAFALLACVTIPMFTPITGAPIVGYVYEQPNVSVQVQSEWQPGGGIGPIFAQRNPQTSVQGGAVSLYTAWSRNISVEPLQGYRDYYVNRKMLAERGNLTAYAVKMQKQIACKGVELQQVNTLVPSTGYIEFPTRMSEQNGRGQFKNSTNTVQLRTYAALTVWADSFSFVHENRTSASVIFASLNGTIEGGTTSAVTDDHIKRVSALKCEIDIEFIDSILKIGDGGLPALPLPTLSSNIGTHVGHCNSTTPDHGCLNPASHYGDSFIKGQPNTLNEVILHFTMAPVYAGIGVDGTAAQWQSQRGSSLLPLPYTSTDLVNNTWTFAEIRAFIDVSIGAMAVQSSTEFKFDHEPIDITTTIFTRKLDRSRATLLLVPMFVMLVGVFALGGVDCYLHAKYNIPLMRSANVGELLRSMHTDYMRSLIDPDAMRWNQHGELGKVRIMFGVVRNEDEEAQVGFGPPGSVQPFGRGPGRRTSELPMIGLARQRRGNDVPKPGLGRKVKTF